VAPLSEELMKRFLVDDVTAEERDRVEAAFVDDPQYFDALCALEDEMILEHLRGEQSDSLSHRFGASFLASPARRERVAQMQALLQALPPANARSSAHVVLPGRSSFGSRARWGFICAASAAAIIMGAIWLRQSPEPGPASPAPSALEKSLPDPTTVATFMLLPNLTRAPEKPRNEFRVPEGVQSIRLRLTVHGAVNGASADLRPVGGAPVPVARALDIQYTNDRTDMFLVVPRALLPRGDYLLTVDAVRADGARETLARRFFSIED
jgi:hypothetical protein